MEPEQEQEILELRAQNFTPRQIAHFLGVRVADVRAVLKAKGEHSILTLASEGELPPVAQCLVNKNCAKRLLENIPQENPAESSLGLVVVARLQGFDRYSICTYLVDYFCLGVKDTMGPRKMDLSRRDYIIESLYCSFPDGYTEITIEQAQAIVLGSIEYAARLGFNPHEDFEKTQKHLGKWNGEPKIQFGYKGKPFYINGPYDNPIQIIKTLENHVGRGNFDYILGIG